MEGITINFTAGLSGYGLPHHLHNNKSSEVHSCKTIGNDRIISNCVIQEKGFLISGNLKSNRVFNVRHWNNFPGLNTSEDYDKELWCCWWWNNTHYLGVWEQFCIFEKQVVLCDFNGNYLPILVPWFFGNSVSNWWRIYLDTKVWVLYAPQWTLTQQVRVFLLPRCSTGIFSVSATLPELLLKE